MAMNIFDICLEYFFMVQRRRFLATLLLQEGERLFRAHSHFDIMKGGTQGFPRHEVSDKQEVLFEDVFAVYGIFNSSTGHWSNKNFPVIIGSAEALPILCVTYFR